MSMLVEISTTVKSKMNLVWTSYTEPFHIVKWNFATPEWQCPNAQNDLSIGGIFSYRMEARDGSMGFDFTGTYTELEFEKLIKYKLEDNRLVEVEFIPEGKSVKIIQRFEAEDSNSAEMQKAGWQAILNNFKAYTENL